MAAGSGATGTAGTQGFLFCDLRGYAAYVDSHGDQAASELLATYRALVRKVIAGHAGAEVRTEGDSVYVVFPTASAAVEAGLAIVAAARDASTPERPIRVGVGVHAGETVASAEGPVGGAVNTAARVCAKAEAGELLVTDTVRSLTRTLLPYRFVGLGRASLKGVGAVALYRVEAVSAGRLAHLRRRLVARRRFVAGIALLATGVLIGGTAAWAVTRPLDCLVLAGDTHDVVARIDPVRLCVVAAYPVGLGPGPIVASRSAVWVGNTDSWTASRIDPATGEEGQVGLPGRPLSVAATARGDLIALAHNDRAGTSSKQRSKMWLAHVAAADTRLITDYELPILMPDIEIYANDSSVVASGFAAIAIWGDRVLVTNRATGQLALCRFAGTGLCSTGVTTVTLTEPPAFSPAGIKSGAGTEAVAVSTGSAWVGDSAAAMLYRYEGEMTPADGTGRAAPAVTAIPLRGDVGTAAVVASEATVWLLRKDGSLTAYDVGSGAQDTIKVDGRPTTLAVAGDALYVGDTRAGAIRRIDPSTGATLAQVPTGSAPAGLAIAGDGSVWVTLPGR